jgi:hypothetical protein
VHVCQVTIVPSPRGPLAPCHRMKTYVGCTADARMEKLRVLVRLLARNWQVELIFREGKKLRAGAP